MEQDAAAGMAETGFDVELRGVTKRYGKVIAVNDFSFAVKRGSFAALLGPSGCGKSTLLRVIAGFLEPDGGEVFIAGKNQRGIPPEKRGTGMVFQDYALFPHMTAGENLEYGLRIRKAPPGERKAEAARTAAFLGLENLLDRYPGELSGGQQQRLALGRAVILKPRILLMDEPLSNLDAKLRCRVREELKEIQSSLGITTIYVTHDQEEALSLADHIAVMNAGRLEQAGPPEEVYNCPRTAFAADFSGPASFVTSGSKTFLLRPEWFYPPLPSKSDDDNRGGALLEITGRVISSEYLGRAVRVKVAPQEPFLGGPLSVDTPAGGAPCGDAPAEGAGTGGGGAGGAGGAGTRARARTEAYAPGTALTLRAWRFWEMPSVQAPPFTPPPPPPPQAAAPGASPPFPVTPTPTPPSGGRA